MLSRQLKVAVFVCGLGALALTAQTTTTTTSTRSIAFAPAGLGATETARILVANTASNSSSGTAASCAGTMSFLNSAGAAIGTATNFTITSGQVASASLAFAQSGLTGVRGAIRAVVQYTVSSSTPCHVDASFETFETSSGATHLHDSGAGGGLAGPRGGPKD
jgi:hypothetical protein